MPEVGIHTLKAPDWYITERETEKTIQKLNSLKELEFYLHNPDEFIRRLAIMRLKTLSSRDVVYTLKELLDSPVETPENKQICEWIVKSRLDGKDDLLFMGSRYAGNLKGSKRYEDLFPVIPEKFQGSVHFNFNSSPSHSAFTLDKEDVVLERDVFFESEFNYGQWLWSFIASASVNFRKSFLAVPAFIARLIKKVIARLSERKKNRKLSHSSSDPGNGRSEKRPTRAGSYPSSDNYYSLRNVLYKKHSVFTYVKKGAYQLFYGIFFPVRFVRKHKLAAFVMLLAVWLLFADTDLGRAFTTKYFSFDLKPVQTLALQKLKVCTSYLSNEFNRLTGMDEWDRKSNDQEAASVQATVNNDFGNVSEDSLYTVNAKNGLNIRVSPNPGSGRVGNGPLEYGSTVVYLEKKEKDASGITWYYVEAADGRIGWVSSRYLKEKEG